ncbi:hypothetical protein TBLA_0D03860 [Henningerozyma blattae CBS 6284]|uniref:NAD+ kinase n=1 Tax=Henningerozyma blattae (strain ATCC 34711 / CBS 6284 / DSM 70876 / NBRC 10599 / NRRL Y-10934 / UCD 77-7) TaxID=1071380 RepID=I2H3D3_HENB6|nr:hypothetical protein TBLA_0D03860 [Tetrapisispora blattae CBS 6284]CCH60885.1 hypothetical protein TBLA_0D03860 [Tetrapisispora blattae CBS 6284]
MSVKRSFEINPNTSTNEDPKKLSRVGDSEMEVAWTSCEKDRGFDHHTVREESEYEGCIELSKKSRNMTRNGTPVGDPVASRASSKSHYKFASHAYGVRMLSKDLSNTKIDLQVENIMIVNKQDDLSLVYLARELVQWLLTNYNKLNVYVQDNLQNSKHFDAQSIAKDSQCKESRIKYWDLDFLDQNVGFFDLIITLGGDGTVLFVSSIFQTHVPPVLPFALGSLGFLTNFQFEYFKEDLPLILNQKIKTNLRMRLECKVFRRQEPILNPRTGKKICINELESEHHVLNELTIDRGISPFISMLEVYGDKSLLTVAQADGLIVATPTGSTAYSLSAGGSLVYPSVNAISVTPICPHTLSFRPIILPDSMNIRVKVSAKSRGTAWAAFDGKNRVELRPGDYILISASPYAFPTLEATSTEFIDSISRSLNWNVREQQKSFSNVLCKKNLEQFENVQLQDKEESVEEVEVDNRLENSATKGIEMVQIDEPRNDGL